MNEWQSARDNVYARVHRSSGWHRARATWVIVSLNILWYLGVELPHGLSMGGYVASGALDAYDLDHGGWFRILSSLFVHFNISHLIFNMVSLASMYVIEMVVGTARFVCLYWLAGTVGSIVSVLIHPNAIFGGASGAIFGIFGAALLLSFKGVFSKGARNQLLFWLALNVVLDVTQPNIGLAAHLCGLIVGMAGMWWLYNRPPRPSRLKVVAWGVSLLTGVCLATVVL